MIFFALIILLMSSLCFAEEQPQGTAVNETIKSYIQAIESTKDEKEKAYIYKQLGDYYVSQGDFKGAAKAYSNAREVIKILSEKEKIQIANYMSWGERLGDAILLLREVLSNNPDNIEARVNLAKFISWSGHLDEALMEAEKVLSKYPNQRGALLVKANVLNWKGKPREAIPIYEQLLKEEEDFDIRLPYSYALLAAGKRDAAKKSAQLLIPIYDYQKRELSQLQDTINQATRPNFEIGYSYYRDSDHNILNRYTVGLGFPLDDYRFDIRYRHTNAKDETSKSNAEEISLGFYRKIDEVGIGGGLGYIKLHNSVEHDFLTGYAKADLDILEGQVGVLFSKSVFTDTSQLIENGIRINQISLYISQRLSDRWSIYSSYSYKDYSDNNHSHDFQITPRYSILMGNPSLGIGYTLRYWNFQRQSGGGYFDPEDFISHQLTLYFNYEKDSFYFYLEPYGGYQSYKRYGDSKSEFYGGGYALIGYKLTKTLSLELTGEGGNYAGGAATGWRYHMVGLRLKGIF